MKTKKVTAVKETRKHEKNALNLYLEEISRIPLLSKSDEQKYASLAAKGNVAAREHLVNSNLRFVISVAKKYQGKGLPLEDLISEGNIGLINAITHFDVEKGYRFITYAVWWIRQAIIRAINERGRMIRLPCNKINELSTIDRMRQDIQQDVQSEPGSHNDTEFQEIAALLETSPEKIAELSRIGQDTLSLDDPALKHENSSSVKDLIVDENSKSPSEFALNSVLKDELEKAIDKNLGKRTAEVIRCRYGLGIAVPLTLKEIGTRYNLSRERVRQIEKLALSQLKKSSQSKKLESYIA